MELTETLRAELHEMLADDELKSPTKLLACLIANEIVQVKLAEVGDSAPAEIRRMFHDKVGVFSDDNGNHIGFRGSLNETFLGLSPELGHVESIDVFPSWVGGRDAERAENALERFHRIWTGGQSRVGIRLFDLPSDVKADLVEIGEEVDLDTALNQLKKRSEVTTGGSRGEITLRSHQKAALEKWEDNGFQGILAHATGSGKTVTGVFAIQRLLDRNITAVIVVPSTEIQAQWVQEVRSILGLSCLLCGGGHSRWKSERLVKAAAASDKVAVVVAVMATARSAAFLSQLRVGFDRCLMIVDEVHRVGAPTTSSILDETSPAYRLGLSATPSRAGDEAGSQKIFDYFGGIVDHYSLQDAIEDGYLTPYRYEVETVRLTLEEQEAWDDWTASIAKLRAQVEREPENRASEERLRRALQERARIKKAAAGKAPMAVDLVARVYQAGDRWLLYCDNQTQLNEVLTELHSQDLPTREYHSAMQGDRSRTLEWFRGRGGILVSMRCLDEGVDIPRANRGLILASSTNVREFIQRRGRLLRKGGAHSIADLLDIVVLPYDDDGSPERTRSLLAPELARALLFARGSVSPHTVSQLEKLWTSFDLPLEDLDAFAQAGFEEVEDETVMAEIPE